jgi:hypothetical protein
MRLVGAVVTPPIRPSKKLPTKQAPTKYYTLHTNPNNAFTLRLNDDLGTSVVGFREWDDAIFIGKMMETYFVSQREWPDIQSYDGALILPAAPVKSDPVLRHLYIQEWDFDDLKYICTVNFLNMVSVNGIENKKAGYSFSGNTYSFSAPPEFYQARLLQLYMMNSIPDLE